MVLKLLMYFVHLNVFVFCSLGSHYVQVLYKYSFTLAFDLINKMEYQCILLMLKK